MNRALDQLSPGAKVAVIRLRSLGDCVLTTPALRLLKESRPDLRIGVVVEERFADVFRGNPDVDAILAPSLPAVISFRPDLVLNLHGGTRSILMTAASGAHIRAGFSHHRGSRVYNLMIPTAQEILGVNHKVHTAEHLASAIFHLGASRRPVPRARLFAEPHRQAKPYAIIHPFAATDDKTWPAERFLDVAHHIEHHLRLEPVFISGPGEDLQDFLDFKKLNSPPLSQTKSFLHGARLFVGNDSGPAHMAAAFGVPVVVLFGPSDPVVWAPWRVEHQLLISPEGIEAISTKQVISALDLLRVQA